MNFKNGRGFKQSEWQNSGIPIIRIQNLNNANAPFNHFHGDYEDDILILAGDLLFAWSGTVGSSFGPHIWERSKGLLNQHIFKVTHSGALDRRYAYYALKEATARIESQVNGSVGLRHVTKKTMNSILIPLPPLDEQKRIVAKLDAVSELAQSYASINSRKRELNEQFRNSSRTLLFLRAQAVGQNWELGEIVQSDMVEDIGLHVRSMSQANLRVTAIAPTPNRHYPTPSVAPNSRTACAQ